MENQTKVNIALIITMIAGFTVVGVINIEPTHYCESKQIKAYCTSVSPSGITCYTLPAKTGGKQCSEGWKEIPQIPIEIPLSGIGNSQRIVCDKEGCKNR